MFEFPLTNILIFLVKIATGKEQNDFLLIIEADDIGMKAREYCIP